MKYQQLVILLPCHSLEDFPLHHEGDEAEGLLANWTAMWHPALIQSAGAMPSWARVDDPPEELAGRLLLIPSVSAAEVPAGFTSRAKDEDAVVVRRKQHRREVLDEALAPLETPPLDDELVADFLALGYCYLQVELLTRQMRYASNLDEIYFDNQVVSAANAAVAGDPEKARQLLQGCYDVLGEERDHFYPVDAFLMDLTLVAETTVGPALRDELQSGHQVNLMLSGQTLDAMARQQPETLAAVRQAVADGQATIIGGEYHEGPTAILDHESMLAELRRGREAYERHLGSSPRIFGRRRFGLSPMLPQILKKFGFQAALHATLDGGHFPDGMHAKTVWEGSDGSQLDALARPPLDASTPETFLNFCMKMGESMDSDHVATLYFAHWPGQVSPWYDDLRRVVRWGPALGKFVGMKTFFEQTDDGGLNDRFEADYYRPPYLKQAIIRKQPDPTKKVADHYQANAKLAAAGSLHALSALLHGDVPGENPGPQPFGDNDQEAASGDAAGAQLNRALESFAAALPRSDAPPAPGYLVANPLSFVRRTLVEVSELTSLPGVDPPVYAAGESNGSRHVVVDVPPMGFVWITGDSDAAKPQKPLVDTEELVLRNEYMEIRFDETTGAIRSLHDYVNRGNRLSQQLALRSPALRGEEGPGQGYSVMVADSIETTLSDPAVGEVVSRGRLVDREGQRLAGFEQRFRLVRGSRVLRIDVQLDADEAPRPDPWNSYYTCRFAWADENVDVYRTVGGVREATANNKFEAPLYVDLDLPKQRTAILTGGLPYHRKIGYRMLDTMLLAAGDTTRQFTLGVGIDVTHPLQEALALLTPPTALFQNAPPPASAASGWLFHVDSKNVVATHWQPLVEDAQPVGFCVRLLEAYGRAAKTTLSTFRAAASARKVDFSGNSLSDCEVQADKIRFEMSPREWAQLEVRWA